MTFTRSVPDQFNTLVCPGFTVDGVNDPKNVGLISAGLVTVRVNDLVTVSPVLLVAVTVTL